MLDQTVEMLHASSRTTVSRAVTQSGSVVRKRFRGEGAWERAVRERTILRRLTGVRGVPQLAGDADPAGRELLLVDTHHGCLVDVVGDSPLGGDALVGLARELAEVLAGIHAAGVQHRDLSPENIVVDAGGGDPYLVDFEFATTSAEDSVGFTPPDEIVGTLPYMAPELTGRTGRTADQRADLYGLGAVLYHLATGHPPFGETDDPLEVIHAHLARTPRPPHEVNPAVPGQLSRILLRLLEKEPDRRYASADGLAHDLARLAAGEIVFRLGSRDFPPRLAPPSRLVGRERETARLAALLGTVSAPVRVALVAGPPGVGKTALLSELRPMVTASRDWLVTGKADQYRHDQVDDAVVACLRGLGRLLLAEPEAECAAVRTRLLDVLGDGARQLAETLPEFATFLGVEPRPSMGDPAELARQAHRAFVEVLAAAVDGHRQIVLVVDDLQWVSGFSLGALDAIVTDEQLHGVIVVGGYRDTEVDEGHPLAAMAQRWQRLGVLADTLTLDNLPPAEMSAFLADMLRIVPDTAAELAEAVSVHAAGNPFDTVEVVNALRREGSLAMTADGWQWDARDVRQFVGAGQVLDLIRQRVDALPETARDALATMACLGETVEEGLFVELAGTADIWLPALEEGLLVPERGLTSVLRFRHDRVQQAVYAAMAEQERARRHLVLARQLTGDARHRALAAEQYLSCMDLLDAAEADAVVELFIETADHARQAGNPGVSEQYLAAAARLLDATGESERDDPRAVGIAVARHAALAALGRFEESDELFAWIQLHAGDDVLLAGAVRAQMMTFYGRARFADAPQIGRPMLARLGWAIPDAEDLPAALAEVPDRVRAWVDHTGDDHPTCTDPRVIAAAQVIDQLVVNGFFSQDLVWVWLVGLAADIWREHGPVPELVGALAHSSFAMVSVAEDYRTGYRATSRILREAQALQHPAIHAFAQFLHTLSAAGWFEPLHEVAAEARASRETILLTGDRLVASATYFASAAAVFMSAPTLAEVEAEILSGLELNARVGNDNAAATLLAYRQACRAMAGRTDGPVCLGDDEFDAEEHLAGLGPNVTAVAYYHWATAHLAALADDVEALDRHSAACMPLLPFIGSAPIISWAWLYRGLACAWRLRDIADDEDGATEVAGELATCRTWLATRAGDYPANFSYQVSLLDAEHARARGDLDGAVQAFERACTQVDRAGMPLHRPFVLERYGRLLLERDQERSGRLVVQRARWLYEHWGAVRKVAALDEEFGPDTDDEGMAGPNAPVSSGSTPLGSVDLLAVLRAFQILGTQTSPAQIHAQVSQVLAMLTGATRVHLVLWDADTGDWTVPCDGTPDSVPRTDRAPAKQDPATKEPAPLSLDEAAAAGMIPMSAFRYVERTAGTLLVPDVTADPRFAADPYFAEAQQCALLGVPVLIRDVPRAVLLLENRLARGAFSGQRLDAVQLIVGELGVSLDNLWAERFRSLVQCSTDLTVVCDRDGQLTYASAASNTLLGIDNTALIGLRITDRVAEEDQATLQAVLATLEPGTPATRQVRMLRADGQTLWVEITLADLSADPAVGGIMGRVHDITERRRLEIELRHAQKLESVGQLASGIAHEINTPIQFITANLRFLTDAFNGLAAAVEVKPTASTAASGTSQTVQEILKEIPTALAETVEGADRVAMIVRAMKVFGHPGGEKSLVDLNEAVRNTLAVAANEIRPAADVVTDLADLPLVNCRIGDINQAVLNLVINAAQAMTEKVAAGGDRGRLTVRTRAEEEQVLIEVADTGVGIPPEIADRVFDQFFTTKDVGRGTGQGLALAHAIVHDHHGGSLTFESTPDQGTVFTVRLPLGNDLPIGTDLIQDAG